MEKSTIDPVFNANQELYLRGYFTQLDQQLGITKEIPVHLNDLFSR
jgi:hypothetical protein